MFVQSLLWETEPSLVYPLSTHLPWPHQVGSQSRSDTAFCHLCMPPSKFTSPLIPGSSLNSSWQPCIVFSEHSDQEHNSLYSVTFPMRLKGPLESGAPGKCSARILLNTARISASSSCGYTQKNPWDLGNLFPLHRPS